MTTVNCAACGVLFALPEHWEKAFRTTHQNFFCPAGHTNYFPHETTEEKLRKEVARLQTQIEHKDAVIVNTRQERDHAKRQRDGLKGAYRRVAVRVKNGVCPCCNRTFKCLADHMRTKHPEFTSHPEVK